MAKGTYTGLFYESGVVAVGHSGFIRVTVSEQGRFTGYLLLGRERYTGQGRFQPGSPPTTSLWRHGRKLLVVTLQPTSSAGVEGLGGSVSSRLWTAEIQADREVFDTETNPAPYAGTYTLVIPSNDTNAVPSLGDGCGCLTVDANGQVFFKGTLADGTVLVQRAPVSQDGAWPLFDSLYGGKGAVLGWLLFTNLPTTDVHGTLSWIRPPVARSKPFPDASPSNLFEVCGSRSEPTLAGSLGLQMNPALLVFSGATSLGEPCTNALSLNTNVAGSKAMFASTNLNFCLKLSTGAFRGTVAFAGANQRAAFKGVVLQKQNAGAGFFLQKGQSGRVSLGPAQDD